MNYSEASKVRKTGLGALITNQIVSGQSVRSSVGRSISQKSSAYWTGAKQAMDPMTVARFLTRSNAAAAIVGRMLGRSADDIGYATGTPKRTYTKRSEYWNKVGMATQGGQKATTELKKIYAFMRKSREQDLREFEISMMFEEFNDNIKQERHKEVMDVFRKAISKQKRAESRIKKDVKKEVKRAPEEAKGKPAETPAETPRPTTGKPTPKAETPKVETAKPAPKAETPKPAETAKPAPKAETPKPAETAKPAPKAEPTKPAEIPKKAEAPAPKPVEKMPSEPKASTATKIAKAATAAATATALGEVSAREESSKRGVEMVSTGMNGKDPGGVSYGKYQLASNTGTMRKFLNSPEGKPFAHYFQNLEPGTPEFSSVYSAVAKDKKEEFAKAQHDFIERTHYLPVKKYAEQKGLNVNNRAIQEALFSQSVQHSFVGNKAIINAASNGVDAKTDAETQLRKLYKSRSDYVSTLDKMDAGTKKKLHARFERETKHALTFIDAPSAGEKIADTSGENANMKKDLTKPGTTVIQQNSVQTNVNVNQSQTTVAPPAKNVNPALR